MRADSFARCDLEAENGLAVPRDEHHVGGKVLCHLHRDDFRGRQRPAERHASEVTKKEPAPHYAPRVRLPAAKP